MKIAKFCMSCQLFFNLFMLLFFIIFQSNVYAEQLTDSFSEKLTQKMQTMGLHDVKLDFNIKIPITPGTDNPADPGDPDNSACNLWATAIYHTTELGNTDSIKRPTILLVTAYRRELMLVAYLLSFLSHDYNIIAVDMRGTGSAEGEWGSMDTIEQYDVAYLIDQWIPDQYWSDGKIGMIGGSYMAILQYTASALIETEVNPENGKIEPVHLKAIAPLSTPSDIYRDISVHGGNFESEFMAVWIAATDLLSVLPPDLFLGGNEGGIFNKHDIEYAYDIWMQHFQQLQIPIEWIMDADNMVKNDWYNDKSPYIVWPQKPEGGWNFGPEYLPTVGTSTIPDGLPVFNTAGWYDIFTRGTLNNYQYGLENHEATDKTLIIGPWYHHDAALMCPGINRIGLGDQDQGLLNYDIIIRWFDWKIKGTQDPFMEEFPVVTYVMGEDRWRAEGSWPLAESRVDSKAYYLSKAHPSKISGDWFSIFNSLNNYKLVEEIKESDFYNYFYWFKYAKKDPVLRHDPPVFHGIVSRSAQRWFGFSPLTIFSQISKYILDTDIDPLMPWEDERLDEVGVLTFTTEPLEEDLEIIGPLKLTFWAKTKFNRPLSQEKVDEAIDNIKEHFDIGDNENLLVEMADKRDVQWVIEVNDVFPNGRAKNITSGWLSAWHRPYDPANPNQMDPNYVSFDPFYDHANKNPLPIEENTIYPYVIEIWPTDNMFKKGHRVRLSISASDVPHLFPFFRPSKNTIILDDDHEARLDFKVTNKANEGVTWKWIDDDLGEFDNISEYLMNHQN